MSLIDSTSAIDASHVADVEATRGAYVGLTLDFEPSFTTLRKKKNQGRCTLFTHASVIPLTMCANSDPGMEEH
jgi:hypothetical protein